MVPFSLTPKHDRVICSWQPYLAIEGYAKTSGLEAELVPWLPYSRPQGREHSHAAIWLFTKQHLP